MNKRILTVVAAMVCAFVLVMLGEALIHTQFAPPALPKETSKEVALAAYKTFAAQAPLSMWLMLLASFALAAIAAGYIARVVQGAYDIKIATAIGFALTLTTALNFYSIPHPTWVVIVGLLLWLPLVILGHALKGRTAKV